MIMVRTLRRDIAKYNADESYDETIEETGWKLVHGDVFRPPKNSRLFAAFVGSGIQIFWMSFITICKYNLNALFVKNVYFLIVFSLRHVGYALTSVQRSLNYSRDHLLHDTRRSRWIFFC